MIQKAGGNPPALTLSSLSFRGSAVLRPDVQARAPATRPAHKSLPSLPAGSLEAPEEHIALLTDDVEASAVPCVIGPGTDERPIAVEAADKVPEGFARNLNQSVCCIL